jgi:hypothetical protein
MIPQIHNPLKQLFSSKISPYLLWIYMLIPILFFYYVIIIFTVNVPFSDDYVLLDSFAKMQTAQTFNEWLTALLKQVNQHRFGFERIVMWLIYKAFGSENIKAQILIGNTFLLGILYLLVKIFKQFRLPWYYFSPIPFLLFNFTYFENATWGIAAIQNTPIIFFALLTVHLLCLQTRYSYYFALIVATLTMFTSGNGMAIWLIGIVLLALQKKWKRLSFWVITTIGLVAFYFFYHYEMIPDQRQNLLIHPFLNGLFLLAFWGNVFFENKLHPFGFPFQWDIIRCVLLGVFLLGIIISLLWRAYQKKFSTLSYELSVLLGGTAFLAGTGMMFVISRPIELPIIHGSEIFSYRYMLLGAVFICLGYLSYLYLFKTNLYLLRGGILLFTVLGFYLNISSYSASFVNVYRQQQELVLDGYYWKNHKMLFSYGEQYGDKLGYNHPTYMINLMTRVDSLGIYRLSDSKIVPLIQQIRGMNTKTSQIFNGKIDTTLSIRTTIVRGDKDWITFTGKNNEEGKDIVYFALKSLDNVFLYPAIANPLSLKDYISNQSSSISTFSYATWKAKVPSDEYEIWVVEKDKNQRWKPLFCNKKIRL